MFDWEAAGHELGAKLGEYHAVVVAGLDPVITGRVAIALARAQSDTRRVAVGDLFAESPPIQDLVHSDDLHGIVDSFLYGVSLTKIARPVPDAGQLYVMPSGTEPPTYEEILPNPRWHRLAAGFREMKALLIVALPASAPNLETLVAAMDGVVFVGDATAGDVPVSRVIGTLREPREELHEQQQREEHEEHQESQPHHERAAREVRRPRAPTPSFAARGLDAHGMPVGSLRKITRSLTDKVADKVAHKLTRKQMAAAGGIGLTLIVAGIAAWLAYRPLAGNTPAWKKEPDCAKLAAAGNPCAPTTPTPTVAMTAATARPDSASDTSKAASVATPPPTVLRVVNPADSAVATAFAVQLMAANTQAGAILKLQSDGKNLPAATFAPAIVDGNRWFKVTTGAFASVASADSLLARLRQRNLLKPGTGNVVRLPFAYRIDSGVPVKAVPAMVAAYGDRGQPVYALQQADGTAWLLVGAYESPEQALLYRESLPSGTQPVLVYRKGRSF
jgi:hypothetical protein